MSPEIQDSDFGGTLEHRVERLIFYATRQGMTIASVVESITDVRRRLHSLEEERNRRAVENARAEEREESLKKALADLQQEVKGMKGVVTKAAGIILGAVLLALLKWVLSGNLSGAL